MRTSRYLVPLLASLALTAACAGEEGYTPISNDKEDQSGTIFNLTEDAPSGAYFVQCDEEAGCDVEMTVGFSGIQYVPAEQDGMTALEVTLTLPDGSASTHPLNIGEHTVLGDYATWSFSLVEVPRGPITAQISLVALNNATVLARSELEATVIPQ